MSGMKVILVLRRHIARGTLHNAFCFNAENAENYIFDFVIWIVLNMPI